MADLLVHGGVPLRGVVRPSANKNAVLPILCATLLTEQPVLLRHVPDITDVQKMIRIFSQLGSEVEFDSVSGTLRLHHRDIIFDPASHALPEDMRSSVMLIPPLIARVGVARLGGNTKGCTLGAREIDPHIDVFKLFDFQITRGVDASIEVRQGAKRDAVTHWLDYASVTTTENFILCAAFASGVSCLINAATEPHVQEFCQFMGAMGIHVDGIGTSTLTIGGKLSGEPVRFEFAEDHHEVATFLALSAITDGQIRIKNTAPQHFPLIDRTFDRLSVAISHDDGWSVAERRGPLVVKQPFTPNILPKIEAAPWPYFPVDLLPIFAALCTRADGKILLWNKVYEGALNWVTELSRFGAHTFQADPHRVLIFGGQTLSPSTVESPYIIRVAIALLMVAISIDGPSRIRNAQPIKRAHPNFITNLRALGANIEWSEDM
ncbi:UDP-N-acetylglucosamine 1-carboxyvinyltransferase [Burkholderia ambifaria]|uniref:UDP-N-acetylglucosamine 1-carboxyvinyltransferase n=1 Tax=Burkholderia ambifaria TaxID=152480 RepID=UPI0022A9422A|nr:UDP-N-acetylglucosamine 1-carboxyvinyltransferase [Burkholderia ambifaria]WAS58444.1 UDP-N-acetylglucosamine 1-carboxyvinyltransferase [Burkholderia ambifaria]